MVHWWVLLVHCGLFGSSKAFLREPQKGFEHGPRGWNFMSDTGSCSAWQRRRRVSELFFGGSIEHNFVLIVESIIKYQLLGFT
jgi:hypothetical protein